MKKFIKPLMLLTIASSLSACGGAKIIFEKPLDNVSYRVIQGRLASIFDHYDDIFYSPYKNTDKKIFSYVGEFDYKAKRSNPNDSVYQNGKITLDVDLDKKIITYAIDVNVVNGYRNPLYIEDYVLTVEVDSDGNIVEVQNQNGIKSWSISVTAEQVEASKNIYGISLNDAYIGMFEKSLRGISSETDFIGYKPVEKILAMDEEHYISDVLYDNEDGVKYSLDETKTQIKWKYESEVDDYENLSAKGDRKFDSEIKYNGFYFESYRCYENFKGSYYVNSSTLEENYEYTSKETASITYGVSNAKYIDISKIPMISNI